jgi:hypothetical protein
MRNRGFFFFFLLFLHQLIDHLMLCGYQERRLQAILTILFFLHTLIDGYRETPS